MGRSRATSIVLAACLRAALVVLASALSLACGPPPLRPPAATLLVTCDDGDALLFVDERLVGRAADTVRHPLGLALGFHRVELRAEGKLTTYREVSLHAGDHATLSVALHPDLDARDP